LISLKDTPCAGEKEAIKPSPMGYDRIKVLIRTALQVPLYGGRPVFPGRYLSFLKADILMDKGVDGLVYGFFERKSQHYLFVRRNILVLQ
jgi:hypothetical protein